MSTYKKELIVIPLTTLDIYKYEKDGLTFYEYDATDCQPPEPMLNTIHILNTIKSKNERVVGRFFHEPSPLYTKISPLFSYKAEELDNGDYEITFFLK